MKLSKYVLRIPMDDNAIIYFNKINGSIILLSKKDDVLVEKGNYTLISDEEYNNLKKCGMLVEGDEVVRNFSSAEFDKFQVTIEMSSLCNLNCLYCYENDKGTREEISDNVLEKVIIYIQHVIKKNDINSVNIGFIGGELLLHKKKLIRAVDEIANVCQKEGKEFHIHIDTNGTIDFRDILERHRNITIAITLSCREDHSLNRPSLNFDSYERIISNIQACGNVLESKCNEIILRYNTHSKNITEFETFVKMVNEKLPMCKIIEPMYTDSYEYNTQFHSDLTKRQFAVWNATKAIEILIRYNYPIKFSINSGINTCIAYKPYSCKIYADGIITMCDSMLHSKGVFSIEQVYDKPERLNELLKEYKGYNVLEDSRCKGCTDIALCMGYLLCREDCNYQVRYDIKEFILTYVKYVLQGKGYMFINM